MYTVTTKCSNFNTHCTSHPHPPFPIWSVIGVRWKKCEKQTTTKQKRTHTNTTVPNKRKGDISDISNSRRCERHQNEVALLKKKVPVHWFHNRSTHTKRDRQLILNAPLTATKGSKGKDVLQLASMHYEYSHAPSNGIMRIDPKTTGRHEPKKIPTETYLSIGLLKATQSLKICCKRNWHLLRLKLLKRFPLLYTLFE